MWVRGSLVQLFWGVGECQKASFLPADEEQIGSNPCSVIMASTLSSIDLLNMDILHCCLVPPQKKKLLLIVCSFIVFLLCLNIVAIIRNTKGDILLASQSTNKQSMWALSFSLTHHSSWTLWKKSGSRSPTEATFQCVNLYTGVQKRTIKGRSNCFYC